MTASFSNRIFQCCGVVFIFLISSLPVAANQIQISGTITEVGSGVPVAGATVAVFGIPPNTNNPRFETTAGNGEYSFEINVPADETFEIFIEAASPAHAPARFQGPPDVDCFFACGGVGGGQAASAGNTFSGIDIALQPGATISGTITQAAEGSPLANTRVQLFFIDEDEVPRSYGARFTGVSVANGGYQTPFAVPAREYVVVASPGFGENFVTQAGPGVSCEFFACCQLGSCPVFENAAVFLPAGQNTSGVDFALAPGAVLSGTLDPPEGVRLVRPYSDFLGAGGPFAFLDEGERDWTIAGLAGGSYFLELVPLSNTSYVRKMHNGEICPYFSCLRNEGAPLDVAPGEVMGNLNFVLEEGGTYTGSVIEAATGQAPEQVGDFNQQNNVVIFDPEAGVVATGDIVSDGQGGLTIVHRFGVPAGEYFVRTYSDFIVAGVGYPILEGHPHLPGFSDAILGGGDCAGILCDLDAAQRVTFAPGVPAELNFELNRGSRISGSVVDNQTLQPLSAGIKLVDAQNRLVAVTRSDSEGNFEFGGFPPGEYFLRTSVAGQLGRGLGRPSLPFFDRILGFAGDCSENLCDPQAGTAIMLDGVNDAGPFSLAVNPGPVIRGQVIDQASGKPVSGPRGFVDVFDSSDAFVGRYPLFSPQFQTTALAPGEYTLVPFVSQAFVGNTEGPSNPSAGAGVLNQPVVQLAQVAEPNIGFTVEVGEENVDIDLEVLVDFIFASRFESAHQ